MFGSGQLTQTTKKKL